MTNVQAQARRGSGRRRARFRYECNTTPRRPSFARCSGAVRGACSVEGSQGGLHRRRGVTLLVQPRCEDTLNGAVHEAKARISRRFGRSQDRTISTPHVPLKRIKYVIN